MAKDNEPERNHTKVSDVQDILAEMKECAFSILREIQSRSDTEASLLRIAAHDAYSTAEYAQANLINPASKEIFSSGEHHFALVDVSVHLVTQEGSLKALYKEFRRYVTERPRKITDVTPSIAAMRAVSAYANIIHRATLEARVGALYHQRLGT